jgi:hypothetical protein
MGHCKGFGGIGPMNTRTGFLAGMFLALAASVPLLSNPHAQSVSDSRTEETARHDAWLMSAAKLPPAPGDQASLRILNDRGEAFDHFHAMMCGTGIPLDQPQTRKNGIGCGFSLDYGPQPELLFLPHEAIVVARFSSYQTFLTPSRLTIYTSIRLSVEQVLQDGPTAVRPGDMIENLVYGGTIELNGKIIHEGIYQDGAYTLQPGHRYVLFLSYERRGNYFTNEKSWELLKGIAVPNHPIEVARMQQGKSQYSGLPEKDFIDAVQKAILERDKTK